MYDTKEHSKKLKSRRISESLRALGGDKTRIWESRDTAQEGTETQAHYSYR